MAQVSAGLLMYRVRDGVLQVLLVHPGGPFWRKKDAGAWTIPKGEVAPGEDEFRAAVREFKEETGMDAGGPFIDLGTIQQKAGKIVHAWAFAGDCDPSTLKSNMTRLEWPRGSGRWMTVPEVDRAEFFTVEGAREKINAAQAEFLERLEQGRT
jgi:predicted NUDIX family NTP pyrophosphohydrolase